MRQQCLNAFSFITIPGKPDIAQQVVEFLACKLALAGLKHIKLSSFCFFKINSFPFITKISQLIVFAAAAGKEEGRRKRTPKKEFDFLLVIQTEIQPADCSRIDAAHRFSV